MISDAGKGLIFLVSQPRAGSTLLQRILGGHPDIHTTAEPWIMLPPLYGLRKDGVHADFNWELTQKAISGFLNNFPNREQVYFDGVKRMYAPIYRKALSLSGKKYFLDKTPRYFLILQELLITFPEASYIFLLRNPVAVLNSIVETWSELFLWRYKLDIVAAPQLIIEGIELVDKRGLSVNYEEFVTNPKKNVIKICNFLEINFHPEMLNYRKDSDDMWRFGDKESIYDHDKPVTKNIDKWKNSLNSPVMRRLAVDYLKCLGPDIISQMGYSYNETLCTLEANRIVKLEKFVPSLSWWINFPIKNVKLIRPLARLRKSLRKHGLKQTILRTRKLWKDKNIPI